eukprot:362997-Chlamydomonas_euryale.AAC.9
MRTDHPAGPLLPPNYANAPLILPPGGTGSSALRCAPPPYIHNTCPHSPPRTFARAARRGLAGQPSPVGTHRPGPRPSDLVDEQPDCLSTPRTRSLFAHVARRPRQQRVRQPDDPVERRAQLVRHGRQKVVLALDRLGQLLNRVQPVRLLHRLHHILAPLRDREEVGLHEAGRVHHLGDPVEHRPHLRQA